MVEIRVYRIRIGQHLGSQLKIKGIDILNLCNPGPFSVDSYSLTPSGSLLDDWNIEEKWKWGGGGGWRCVCVWGGGGGGGP